jgi:hypothetical protein
VKYVFVVGFPSVAIDKNFIQARNLY